jgi:murein DD-endopeptidase MepM/ murein hydrolase activator NlpD
MLEVLGGRFLRRAFPQKVNLVPSCVTDNDADALAVEPSQPLMGANRRVRTSAAMIGLAISMGAYSLLAPHQGDSVAAAEPVAADPANVEPGVSSASSAELAVLSPESIPEEAVASSRIPASPEVSSLGVTHTVQVGQTLWRIAQLHKVSVSALAEANHLPSNAVLMVGQVLSIPQDDAGSSAVSQSGVPFVEPVSVVASAQSGVFLPASDSQSALHAQQTSDLTKLQEKQNRLKVSLAELKSEESNRLSASAKPAADPAVLVSYQVSPGDTLSSIAQARGISYAELARLNNLTDPNRLIANQVIRVPQGSAEAVTQPIAASYQANMQLSQGGERPDVPVVSSLSALQPEQTDSAQELALAPSANVVDQPVHHSNALPNAQTGRQNDQNVSSGQYVNSLVGEVVKLREKYNSKPVASDVKQVAVNPTTVGRGMGLPSSNFSEPAQPVNSEFKPNNHLEILRAELRNLQSQRRGKAFTQRSGAVNAPKKAQRQVVARASIGADNYAPIVNATVGKMVSPELPPLGKPDAYVPSGTKFAGYIWPAQGVLTSPYGWRWGRMHKGIDIAAPIGTPVVAAAPGVVITAGWNDGGYGNLVEIQHPDGSVTLYGHNDRILVRVGQQVAQAQQIAEMGSTGYSTGPHSHFEVHLPGQGAVNPMAYLPNSRS